MSVYDTDDVIRIVRSFLGDQVPAAQIYTWINYTQRQLALRCSGTFNRLTEDIDMTANIDHKYYPVGNIVQLSTVILLDEDDSSISREVGELEKVPLRNIWEKMHAQHVGAELRVPTHWGPAGVRLQAPATGPTGCEPQFMLYPQPISGAYTTRKLRVYGYGWEDDVTAGSDERDLMENLRRVFVEGVLRFAYLYVSDHFGYYTARAEYDRGIADFIGSYGTSAAAKQHLTVGRGYHA